MTDTQFEFFGFFIGMCDGIRKNLGRIFIKNGETLKSVSRMNLEISSTFKTSKTGLGNCKSPVIYSN